MTGLDVAKAESVLRMLCEYYTADFWYMSDHCRNCKDIVESAIEELRSKSNG